MGSCNSQICKAARNFSVNKIAQQGSAPAVSSRFAKALGDYGNLIEALDTTISTGIDVGSYGHSTSLYAKSIVPPPPPSERECRNSQGDRGDQPGCRGSQGGLGGGGAGRSGQQPAQQHSDAGPAPMLFVKIHSNTSLNFHEIRLPEVRVCVCGGGE